jgi:hypothetical protein
VEGVSLQKLEEQIGIMLDSLLKQQNPPSQFYPCPQCGGKLRLHFQMFSRGGKNLLGIQVKCDKCFIAMVIDRSIDRIPGWIANVSP